MKNLRGLSDSRQTQPGRLVTDARETFHTRIWIHDPGNSRQTQLKQLVTIAKEIL